MKKKKENKFLNNFNLIDLVGSNGQTCGATADCLTITNFDCRSNVCQCNIPYTWTSSTGTCDCVAPYFLDLTSTCGIIFLFND